MTSRNLKLWSAGLLALLVALAGGCDRVGSKRDLPVEVPVEEVVRLRAQVWADALLAGDFEGAYALTSPGYRQFSSVGRYSSEVLGASNWNSAVVDAVECDTQEGICSTVIMVEYEIARLKMKNTRPLNYKWLEADGEWWLYVPVK